MKTHNQSLIDAVLSEMNPTAAAQAMILIECIAGTDEEPGFDLEARRYIGDKLRGMECRAEAHTLFRLAPYAS